MMQETEDDSILIMVNNENATRRSSGGLSPQPDVISETSPAQFTSLDIYSDDDCNYSDRNNFGTSLRNGYEFGGEQVRSFLLMDEKENIQIKSFERFCQKLKVSQEAKIKVVSIFGNTGDGKSHTLNHAFFGGKEVFKTSAEQTSCTMGIWASYHRPNNVLCLDTEGLLGTTENEFRQRRMLLKVLAISDIIIYRTRSERLHSDMFTFLGTASKAFTKYFSNALQTLALNDTPQSLGPAVIIFHETQNTDVLKEDDDGKKEEDILRERFANLKQELSAFSSLRYVGIRTSRPPTNYEPLKMALEKEIRNTTVRSPRQPKVVYEALHILNKKYNGELSPLPNHTFPEQYFTCTTFCKSCGSRCQLSMGHLDSREDHRHNGSCTYQHQYENKVYLCKKCNINGRQVIVNVTTQTTNDSSWMGMTKYFWSGSVIECPYCGEIYRARQHWYGNKSPEQDAVSPQIVHVWNDGGLQMRKPAHSAQMVLDGVSFLTDAVATIAAQPTKSIMALVTDAIRPDYWRPDSEIIHCKGCTRNFERLNLGKHHCRSCGDGFCNACSKHKMPVPNRGWKDPVRVCNECRDQLTRAQRADRDHHNGGIAPGNSGETEANVIARRCGEVVINTLSNIGAVLEYPKEIIKDTARPSYWVPDAEAPTCHICEMVFGCSEEINNTPLVPAGPTINGKTTNRHASSTTMSNGKDSPKSSPAMNNGTRGGSNKGASVGNSSPTPSTSSGAGAIDRRRHHCRACGNAICATCSKHRRPVPERGWLSDTRVCNQCYFTKEE
ncbi:zinc finger FYVE domain-containing protein 1-like isoform X2 [Uranotaenia lowii]|uniref:zinc finger FYVE domain-containing protein 1-like isoform X2 n=1 Tax=Uranotaenia lowii TaxID=190385 RepID=UPI002479CA1F|nr:zinc finger FYVE domain-containing protein 1-like isoform X2 [Uranotaenia lowii]XP_055607208.1 zinc finger FYVE domain-containing protein 1-like isoform X2 [Uranotaenia lowii]